MLPNKPEQLLFRLPQHLLVPRAREQFQRAEAARRPVSLRFFPARTKEGRKGAYRAAVSPDSERNHTVIPPGAGITSNTHPAMSRDGGSGLTI